MTDTSLKALHEDIEKYLMTDEERLKKLEGQSKVDLLKQMYEEKPSQGLKDQISKEELKIKKERADAMRGSFGNIFKGFKQALEPVRYIFGIINPKQVTFTTPENKVRKNAVKKAETKAYVLYDVYKKAHGMTSW